MKRTAFYPLFGLAALALATPGRAATDRYYTLINADATHAQFADDNAKRSADGTVRLSLLTVPSASAIAYSISEVTINCASLKSRTLSTTSYTADGRASLPAPGEPEAIAIQPGTLGMVLKNYICDGIDPYPRSKTFKSLQDALDRGHDLITTAAAEK